MGGWYGVDLDGTLAHYDGWRPDGSIGAPIPRMVARVKKWLAEEFEVRIFTARAAVPAVIDSPEAQQVADLVEEQKDLIRAWCKEHLGQELPITHAKDYAMIELWDDRAIQVVINTGERVDGGD